MKMVKSEKLKFIICQRSILFLLFIAFANCSGSEVVDQDTNFSQTDTLFDDDGNMSDIVHLVNGKLEGYQYSFFPTGELQSKLFFVNGVQQDSSFTYYINGNLRSSYLVEKGRLDGFCTQFYSNGDTMNYGKYYNGSLAGLWINIDSLGNRFQILNGDTIKEGNLTVPL